MPVKSIPSHPRKFSFNILSNGNLPEFLGKYSNFESMPQKGLKCKNFKKYIVIIYDGI